MWLVFLLVLFTAPVPAAASQTAEVYRPVCHATSEAHVTVAAMAAGASRWNCSGAGWDNERPAVWLRFEASRWQGAEAPTAFVSHITRFRRISLSAVDADGSIRTRSYASDQVQLLHSGPHFMARLPELRETTRQVIVRLDQPHNVVVLTESRLTRRPNLAGWNETAVVTLALIAGMLVLPLLFDVGFYAVLRERFLLLHAGMVGSMLVYLMFSGGFLLYFVLPPIDLVAVAGPVAFALGALASAHFLLTFLEADVLPKLLRHLLRCAGWWSAVVPGTLALQFDWTQPFDNSGYFFTFAPVLVVFVATLATALVRGSRAARLIAVAWVPILLCCADQIMRGIGLYTGPAWLEQSMYMAFALEVVMVWLAVMQRFMALKQERDRARLEALALGELSERDPLTGLLNRRVIERRFRTLHRNGYETLALLDLDRFKEVNDRFGHALGDEVLRACANVLRDLPDVLAIRMGGEEFLLLMRGRDSLARAEQMRQSLPGRIAREVPGLDRVVTASMGAVQMPRSIAPEAGFAEMYDRADKLLYEAKAAGRNRTMTEKLSLFRRPVTAKAAA
ncbi:GGDEF domain-containing protein [Croceibacterium soli]|uniref:GGDEF domain-containing protein n=1 Tax=Croceibacterium soli TaxID=1739690 RepID=UPI0013680B1F|nr:diguanylate cyclase [Croceibacterium soli]